MPGLSGGGRQVDSFEPILWFVGGEAERTLAVEGSEQMSRARTRDYDFGPTAAGPPTNRSTDQDDRSPSEYRTLSRPLRRVRGCCRTVKRPPAPGPPTPTGEPSE